MLAEVGDLNNDEDPGCIRVYQCSASIDAGEANMGKWHNAKMACMNAFAQNEAVAT